MGIPASSIRTVQLCLSLHISTLTTWWRHQMETFSALLDLCAGNSPPVNSPHKGHWRGTLMFSLICALNKRLSKQSWGWWFETPTRSFGRHCNENTQELVEAKTNPQFITGWILEPIHITGTFYPEYKVIHVISFNLIMNRCINQPRRTECCISLETIHSFPW